MKKLIFIWMAAALLLLCGCGRSGKEPAETAETVISAEEKLGEEELNAASELLRVFARQRLGTLVPAEAERDELIAVLKSYIKNNLQGKTGQKPLDAGGTMYEVIAFDEMNRAAEELFGFRLVPEKMEDYIVSRYDGDLIEAIYDNGEFYFYPEACESVQVTAVVYRLERLDNGTVDAKFNLCVLSDGESSEGKTDAQRNIIGNGEAVLKPCDKSGAPGYQLLSFSAEYGK